MLGMALVAGSVGLLVAGTCYGLYAYYTSVKTTHCKLEELEFVTRLVNTLEGLEPNNPALAAHDHGYDEQLARTQAHVTRFREFNARNVSRALDPDNGTEESALLDKLDKQLRELEAMVRQHSRPDFMVDATQTQKKQDEKQRAYENARLTAEHLRLAVITDIQRSGQESNSAIRQSIWISGIAAGWAIALVLTMLYYFRAWLFAPIRELQAGVQRVHGGDFNQPITLSSGDELQELADEFNTMVARLSAVYADLARQVNERSRQLVRSERMVSVGFLAAGVAHEINNPLASILFCSEALERRLQEVISALAVTADGTPPAEAEVLARYLKMIQQEALRCKDITQKLLDFSRTGERRREPTDLTGLVRGVLEVARHLPTSRGKAIEFEPTGYVVASVNAQDLKSVILNLVVNALDSLDDGGRLAITLSTIDESAELVFTDTGCGMSPEVLQNIFEPFFTRNRTGKGTGLGLFISHQIVDQHGGTITATSAGPGLGSTFTVRIPLQDIGGNQDTGSEPVTLPFPGSPAAA